MVLLYKEQIYLKQKWKGNAICLDAQVEKGKSVDQVIILSCYPVKQKNI